MAKISDQALQTAVESRIFTIRWQKVILDADLAELYGVETKKLNQAVKRNADRFPGDFAFVLTRQEVTNLKSQIVTSSLQHVDNEEDMANRSQIVAGSGHGGRRKLPMVFTEHGAIMAANVLNSPKAVQMSVFVVRAFVRMRATLTDTRELARKLAALEREVKTRLDTHDAAIVDNLRRILDLIAPPALPEPPRKQIGFSVKEKRAQYRTRKKKKT